jgi:polyhydroxybutyrate depolymerase
MRIIGLLLLGFHGLFAQKYSMEHEGKKRAYLVHLPSHYEASRHYPLILNLHGWGGSPEQQERYTQMDKLADKEGFIVVYPEAYHHFWNAGVLDYHYEKGRDDVGFVRKMIGRLTKEFAIAEDSIYVVGISLGGIFSHRLGCELGDRIAAFASVSGLISDSTEEHCPTYGNMPMLMIHGTRDPVMKYAGSREYRSVAETFDFWKRYNHCHLSDTIAIPDHCPKDKTKAFLIKSVGDNQAQVWFVKIQKGGHTWPGGTLSYWYFGRTCQDFDASLLIWDFFKQFSLKKGRAM